ncbi:DUF3412 domain-containing protein [Vibrio chagasii]|nr:DUF3412 domain-containing protein [Vibrio chagasii]
MSVLTVKAGDAYSYNWSLHIEPEFQLPFDPTHESMAALTTYIWTRKQKALRRICAKAFSGIVAGNVKAEIILRNEKNTAVRIVSTKLASKWTNCLTTLFGIE